MDGENRFSPIYHLHDGIDVVLDEKGDQFIALRKVQWAGKNATTIEPNPEKAKYEIRRWKVTPEGETPLKGVTFLTDEGPNDAALGLVKNGYGNTTDLLLTLKERDNFESSVKGIYSETDNDNDGEYFDAREMLLS